MVETALVDRHIEDAEILMDSLERAGVPVRLAYWILGENEGWGFCVASDLVPKSGPIAVLKKFTRILSTQRSGFTISLENFHAVSPEEPFVLGLDVFLDDHSLSSPTHLRRTSIGGTFVEDCYVFPRRVHAK